ncbi:MAG: hypothetical protein WDO19_11450 [Bacteroidota bacterium]
MSADDIINTAFRKNFIIPGEGMFILEGHPGRDELRIVPADRAFIDNLNCFCIQYKSRVCISWHLYDRNKSEGSN